MSAQKTTSPEKARPNKATVAKAPRPNKAAVAKAPRASKAAVAEAPRASKAAGASTSSRKARSAAPTLPPIGPDIDLDEEEVYLPDGSRLTEARATEIAERALARHYPGRPSLSGGSKHTPNLTVRVTEATREGLEAIAAQQGRRLSDVTRDALDEYARRHANKRAAVQFYVDLGAGSEPATGGRRASPAKRSRGTGATGPSSRVTGATGPSSRVTGATGPRSGATGATGPEPRPKEGGGV